MLTSNIASHQQTKQTVHNAMITKEQQYPTFDDITNAVVSIAKLIKQSDKQYDYVLGISRGGLFPATLLSYLIDTPMLPVSYSSKKGAGNDKNHHNDLTNVVKYITNKRVIVVDDICDSGYTLQELVNSLNSICDHIDTAAVYYKISKIYQPTFFSSHLPPDSPFIYFPWELNSIDNQHEVTV